MDRREFLELAGAVIGGLSVRSVRGRGPARGGPFEVVDRDDFYIEKGLTGMAWAGGWFDAHWGAAVLAGHYLSTEKQLGEGTRAAIRRQLDAMIRLREPQFAPFPEEPAEASRTEDIPRAALQAVQGGLRAHGHAPIFAALAVRALRDAPQWARPQLIQGICGLSRQIARINPQKPQGEAVYATTESMIARTFDSLARFEHLLGRPSVRRPNFTHMITHTEALMTLESMGYGDLVRAGHAGHHAHISAPVPDFDPDAHPVDSKQVTLRAILSHEFWADGDQVALGIARGMNRPIRTDTGSHSVTSSRSCTAFCA